MNQVSVEAGDLLSRLDNAISQSDALPRLDGDGWLPGDPLYDGGGCYHREMLQELPCPGYGGAPGEGWVDSASWPDPRPTGQQPPRWCETCDVGWAGGECWICGNVATDSAAASLWSANGVTRPALEAVAADIAERVRAITSRACYSDHRGLGVWMSNDSD